MLKTILRSIEYILNSIFPEPPIVKELKNLSGLDVIKKYGFYKKINETESFLPYSNNFVRELISELKYFNNKDSARICGEILLEKINLKNGDILVPIPLSKQRLKERGFNQCEKICEIMIEISKKDLIISTNNLIRTVNNKSQTNFKSDFERAENILGIFKIKDCTNFREKNLILIDDVITTGATLNEAIKEVLKCNPNSIKSFTISH